MSAQTTPPVGERERAGLSAPAATGGVITIALFIVLFFVSGFLNAEIPKPDAPLKEITDWRGDNGSAIRLAGALFMASALVFTAFSAWLASVVRGVGRAQDSLVVFAGGLIPALGLFLNGALQWVAERPDTDRLGRPRLGAARGRRHDDPAAHRPVHLDGLAAHGRHRGHARSRQGPPLMFRGPGHPMPGAAAVCAAAHQA